MLLREHLPESLRSQAYQLLCDDESNTNHYLLWEPTCNCCRHESKGKHLHIQAEYKSNSQRLPFIQAKGSRKRLNPFNNDTLKSYGGRDKRKKKNENEVGGKKKKHR